MRLVAEARPREAAADAPAVAVLFGTERIGLSNEQLRSRACAAAHSRESGVRLAEPRDGGAAHRLRDPTWRSGERGATRCRRAMRRSHRPPTWNGCYVHLQQVMDEVDFRDRTQSGTNLMQRIRRLFNRAELDAQRGEHPARHPHCGAEQAARGGLAPLVTRRLRVSGLRSHDAAGCRASSRAMARVLAAGGGNPAAVHARGRAAAAPHRARARARSRRWSVRDARDIVFTSGATEANNLAILGHARRLGCARMGGAGTCDHARHRAQVGARAGASS